jgi:hypothetical protein
MRLAGHLLVEHDLSDPSSVAHIEKDQVAMVTPTVHPTHQDHRLPILLCAKLTASMRPL